MTLILIFWICHVFKKIAINFVSLLFIFCFLRVTTFIKEFDYDHRSRIRILQIFSFLKFNEFYEFFSG